MLDVFLQAISLESTIRMRWFDKRITLTNNSELTYRTDEGRYLLFNRDPVRELWFPDVFIQRAKEIRAPVYKIPPAYLRIYEHGLMLYSARVNYDLSCPMVFDNYPVDEQVCDIVFESWGHTNDKIVFQWNKDDVVINQNISLNQHSFQVALLTKGGHNFSTGMYLSMYKEYG